MANDNYVGRQTMRSTMGTPNGPAVELDKAERRAMKHGLREILSQPYSRMDAIETILCLSMDLTQVKRLWDAYLQSGDIDALASRCENHMRMPVNEDGRISIEWPTELAIIMYACQATLRDQWKRRSRNLKQIKPNGFYKQKKQDATTRLFEENTLAFHIGDLPQGVYAFDMFASAYEGMEPARWIEETTIRTKGRVNYANMCGVDQDMQTSGLLAMKWADPRIQPLLKNRIDYYHQTCADLEKKYPQISKGVVPSVNVPDLYATACANLIYIEHNQKSNV